ncbi:complement factor H-related protein 5-like isoform X3 [Anser cygnoides]|uniref:complement factor H-related protein 5-like isoform X3 n=1 Tax=Anser cygnoides TaxID=8845 RepID=UPI0034D2753D
MEKSGCLGHLSVWKYHVEGFQQLPMLHLKAGARRSMSLVKQFATSVMKDFRSLVPLKFFAEGEIGQHHHFVKMLAVEPHLKFPMLILPALNSRDVTCEPPPEIAGGKVQGVKKPRYLPGDTAHYQCWQGFLMTGASTVTCQNGTWTELPQCKGEGRKCGPPPDIENGDILSFQLKQYPQGATLKYKCARFYILKGPEQITCTDGQWTNPPVCLAACTVSEEDMDRNNIELRWRGGRKLYSTSGDFVEFDCKIGYVQDPASSPFRVQCMDGTLEYPRCKQEKDCTVLEMAMERNNIKLRQSRRRSYTYRSEEYILFTCKISYREVSNPEDFNVQCQDGVINYPRCEYVTCEPPPEIAGGKVQGVKKPRYLPGETAHYQCWQGFLMTGASTVTCQNGTWTELPQCKGKGRKCGPPPDIENGDILSFPLPEYDQGETVKYKCASFHILKGPEQITCTDGQWTNPPVCLAACTVSEEDMDRNNIELRWRGGRKLYSTSGDFVEFDCKIGYVQDPASSPFRVQCMDGTLEYPRCKPGKDCTVLEMAMERNNIKLRQSRRRSYTYRSEEYILFTCKISYREVSNPEDFNVQCQDGVINYPRCEYVTCEPPPEIAGGKVQGVKKPRYLPGETAHYQCWQGFLMTGASTVTCQNGTWTELPQCKGKGRKCGPPPDIENGDILSFPLPEYDQGETVKYKCASFHILKGPEQITCTDGQWTNPPVCLAACTTSEEDMDRNNIELKWTGERKLYLKSGDFVEFDCKIGYVQDPASSPFRVQCMDGTLEYPRCQPGKDCTVLEMAMERNNIKLRQSRRRSYTYRSEEYILFTCKISYREVSNPEDFNAQCQDGVINYPRCEYVTCEPPPEIAGGKVQGVKKPRYLPGETAHYQCWQGFLMTGASTVTCQNGTWTELPQCKAACTASEEDMDRNNIELRWRGERKLYSTSGDFVEFDCKIGYVQDPASSPFRVQCMDGTLEYPWCKPGRNCRLSETEMKRNNIKLRQSRRRSNTYRSKETISFTCPFSYREVSNPEDFEAQCKDGVINYPRCEWYFG